MICINGRKNLATCLIIQIDFINKLNELSNNYRCFRRSESEVTSSVLGDTLAVVSTSTSFKCNSECGVLLVRSSSLQFYSSLLGPHSSRIGGRESVLDIGSGALIPGDERGSGAQVVHVALDADDSVTFFSLDTSGQGDVPGLERGGGVLASQSPGLGHGPTVSSVTDGDGGDLGDGSTQHEHFFTGAGSQETVCGKVVGTCAFLVYTSTSGTLGTMDEGGVPVGVLAGSGVGELVVPQVCPCLLVVVECSAALDEDVGSLL